MSCFWHKGLVKQIGQSFAWWIVWIKSSPPCSEVFPHFNPNPHTRSTIAGRTPTATTIREPLSATRMTARRVTLTGGQIMVQKIISSWFKNKDLDFFSGCYQLLGAPSAGSPQPAKYFYVTIPTPTQECTNCVGLICWCLALCHSTFIWM